MLVENLEDMKNKSLYKLPILGLLLIGASAFITIFSTKKEIKRGIGDLRYSTLPDVLTCTEDASPAVQCQWTESVNEASSTTTAGNDISTQTSAGDIETDTDKNPPLQNTSCDF